MQQGVLPLRLPDFASFENYLPATNQETITHLHEFLTLQEAKRTAYLWGESGTGKTHLLYAACKTVSNSIYISLQDRNIQTDILVSVEDQSLICLDDLQCAALNLDWERRLMTLVEEVELDGRRLIVAARLPPDGLNLKLPDLVSRLAGKQIFRLNPIGDEERIEIFIDRGRASRNGDRRTGCPLCDKSLQQKYALRTGTSQPHRAGIIREAPHDYNPLAEADRMRNFIIQFS